MVAGSAFAATGHLSYIGIYMPGFNIPMSATCNDLDAYNESSYIDQLTPTNLVETSRAHRFLLSIYLHHINIDPFGALGKDNILIHLNKCSRPSVEIDEITIHNGQDEIYRPGKNRWKPIEFTFYEVVKEHDEIINDNMTARMIFKLWSESTIDINRSRINDPKHVSDVTLALLNGSGRPIWQYKLYRCWPSKIEPSQLDYSSKDINVISVTMRYDKAIEENTNRI